jgi:hypothetical protein
MVYMTTHNRWRSFRSRDQLRGSLRSSGGFKSRAEKELQSGEVRRWRTRTTICAAWECLTCSAPFVSIR